MVVVVHITRRRPCGKYTTPHPAKKDLDKKWLPKQKTIQNFNIDALGFKNKKWKSSNAGNRSYQLTHAGWPANQGQIGRHLLADNSYFLRGRVFISCFSEPLGINIEILNGLLLW